ncbi:MAG TPA: hypothetical protein VK821_08585, partial [Dehalococcoidia bacterium]|nr:hypothetical protein [Dehalococcoidia bacterium]
GWPEDKVRHAVDQLTLGPRDPFWPQDGPTDAYPWRFNRGLSYLRRPLLLRNNAQGAEFVWGSRNLFRAGQYLLDLCMTGRLKARSELMKRVITSMRQKDGEAFNDTVADLLNRPATIVKKRVRRIGSLRIARPNGEDLGDIDVLVVNKQTRRITAVETKDLEFARTPAELSNEVSKLAMGSHSTAHKHRDRMEWARGHIDEILRWLEIPSDARRWRVHGIIVTSRDLLTPLTVAAGVDTVSYRSVRESPENFA